jgi:N12 class adenine-specific DNA methylase
MTTGEGLADLQIHSNSNTPSVVQLMANLKELIQWSISDQDQHDVISEVMSSLYQWTAEDAQLMYFYGGRMSQWVSRLPGEDILIPVLVVGEHRL